MALPKFSRNYTRSGAYENPVTPVDTKTGAIIAQAISNVGNITANFIERQNQAVNAENAAIKKMLNGINKNATTRKEQYAKSLGEHGLAQNEEFARVGTEMIDYLEEQETLLAMYKRNNDSENARIAENNIFKTNLAYGKLTQVIKETPDALKTYSEDSLASNNGKPGGIALSGAGKQNNQYWFGFSAYQGSSAGSSSSLIWDKDSDEKDLSMVLNSKEIQQNKNLFTEDEEFQGIVVDPLIFLQSDPGRIPDIKTTGVQILGAKTDDNPNGVNLVGKNGQVNDLNFYDTSSPKKITRKAGKVYVQYNYNETALIDIYQKSVTDNLVTPFTTNSDISRANAISNNVFNYEMIPDANAANENGSPFSVSDQTKFQDSTLAYVRGLVPPPKEFVFDEDEYDGIMELTDTEKKAGEEKINIQVIDKLKIPTTSDPIRDRFAIAGVKPKIDLKATNELLRQKGFETNMAVTDDEGKITVIKVESGLSGKNRVVQITQDTDADTVKDLLKQVVTGKTQLGKTQLPVKK
jgi:hypothetical protein